MEHPAQSDLERRFRTTGRLSLMGLLLLGFGFALAFVPLALLLIVTGLIAPDSLWLYAVAPPLLPVAWLLCTRRINDSGRGSWQHINLFFGLLASAFLAFLLNESDWIGEGLFLLLASCAILPGVYFGFHLRSALLAPSEPGPNNYGPNPGEVTP